MEGLDVVAANFPRQRYQGLSLVGLTEIQVGGRVNNALFEILLTQPGPAHTISNFAPNEYRGVVNPSSLVVYKGSKQGWNSNGNCN